MGGGGGGGGGGGNGGGNGGNQGCGGGGGRGTETFDNNWWNSEPSSLTPCELLDIITRLVNTIGLTTAQIQWLYANPDRAAEIDRYVGGGSNSQNNQIAKDHLEKMITDAQYSIFVENHAQTGDHLKMWWEDENWLAGINYVLEEEIFNFYMEAAKPKNSKPVEFTDKCTGLPVMIQASSVDKKERAGYITLDGKFIYSPDIGTTVDKRIQLRIKNGHFITIIK